MTYIKEETESPRVDQGPDQDGPEFLLTCRPGTTTADLGAKNNQLQLRT